MVGQEKRLRARLPDSFVSFFWELCDVTMKGVIFFVVSCDFIENVSSLLRIAFIAQFLHKEFVFVSWCKHWYKNWGGKKSLNDESIVQC